ncbi:MAG: DUF1800 domain-containing protein [Pyrinomonadaceae bacterium]
MSENIFSRFVVRCAARWSVVCCALGVAASAAFAAPTILTDPNSTRAIAIDSLTHLSEPFPLQSPGQVASTADRRTRVMLFVMNLELLAGEGINALNVEVEDGTRRVFPLKVEAVNDVPGFESIKAVVVRLHDELGDSGDVLIRVSLHGVSSNRARIAIGHMGGGLADDPGSVPAPAPSPLPVPTPTPGPKPYTGAASYADTVRFLEQATWGPTNAEVARTQALGFRSWLDEQFNLPMSSYPSYTLMPTDSTQGCPQADQTQRNICTRDNYTMYPLQVKFFQNALNTSAQTDQLRQRVAWALHQIFVVSGRDISYPAWMTYYLQILDRNAFGNFRTLLGDITLNPGMGEYLNMRGNTRNNPNENYAREILQLFSLGVDELNLDGTPRLDANGKRLPTYDQDDVTNFARVFTGWNLAPAKVTVINGTPYNVANYQDPMIVTRATNHDRNPKTLLGGFVLPGVAAGQETVQSANADLNAALDNIFNHPNVGPFIGKQLIQHLVTSNPSPAYVERVARVFNNDCDALYPEGCSNGRGNLRPVVRAILLDPEARGDAKTDPNYGKLREPVQFLNNILRGVGATAFNNPGLPSDGVIGTRSQRGDLPSQLDQPVFLPATVFSYYTPLYEVPGTGLFGPAFEILSTSTSLRRANVTNTLVYSGIGTNADTPAGTSLNLAALEQQAGNPAQLVETLNALLLHNTMTDAVKTQVINAVNAIPTSDGQLARKRAQVAVYLVSTSPQYQVQR